MASKLSIIFNGSAAKEVLHGSQAHAEIRMTRRWKVECSGFRDGAVEGIFVAVFIVALWIRGSMCCSS
jgi:hypothetical protein